MILNKSSFCAPKTKFLLTKLKSLIKKKFLSNNQTNKDYLHKKLFVLINSEYKHLLLYIKETPPGSLLYVFYKLGDEFRDSLDKYQLKKPSFEKLQKYFQSTVYPAWYPSKKENIAKKETKFIGFERDISDVLIMTILNEKRGAMEKIDKEVKLDRTKQYIVKDYISKVAAEIVSMKGYKWIFGLDKKSLVGVFERVFIFFLKKRFRDFDKTWLGSYLLRISVLTYELVNSNIEKYLELMTKLNVLFDENGDYSDQSSIEQEVDDSETSYDLNNFF